MIYTQVPWFFVKYYTNGVPSYQKIPSHNIDSYWSSKQITAEEYMKATGDKNVDTSTSPYYTDGKTLTDSAGVRANNGAVAAQPSFYKRDLGGGMQYFKMDSPLRDPNYTPIGYSEMISELKTAKAPTGTGTMFDYYKQNNPSLLSESPSSTYVYDSSGNFTTRTAHESGKKPKEYAGDGGYTQSGAKLYKLKDGTVTTEPPPGETKETPKTQDELRSMGASAATGGVVTDAMNSVSQATRTGVASILGDSTTQTFQPIIPITLKNKEIAKANPSAIANPGFINALYQEAYGRNATQAELDRFKANTVKDASNIILGASKSPFTGATGSIGKIGDAEAGKGSERLNTSPLGPTGVNALFMQYYGRNADAKEMEYWQNKSDADLRPQLIPNSATELAKVSKAKDQGLPVDVADVEDEKKRKAGLAFIDSSAHTDLEKIVLRQMLEDSLKSGGKVFSPADAESLLKTAATNAESNLNPYYANKTQQEIDTAKTKFADIRNEVARYSQQEGKSYKELLDTTRKNIRASGLTFSGSSRQILGGEGALNRAQDVGQGGVNAFGLVEGEIPQARRYNWEDKMADVNQRNRDIGLKTEQNIGSRKMEQSGLSGTQVLNPYGNGIDYTGGLTRDQYLVKKEVNGVPQEGYIRSGSQGQFLGAGGKEASYTDPNYRYLSQIELDRQAEVEKQRLANLNSMIRPK